MAMISESWGIQSTNRLSNADANVLREEEEEDVGLWFKRIAI